MHDEKEYVESQRRENLVEHTMLSELLQDAWLRRQQPLDVLRGEVDASGYDLARVCNGFTRHVQTKSSKKPSKTAVHGGNGRLADMASGCVIWATVEEERASNRVVLHYRRFGDKPGEALPTLGNRKMRKPRARGENAFRANTFRVTKGRFIPVGNIAELSDRIFGPPDG
ncbi:MAG TPA: hypothetical protein VFH47_03520 [Candidatus Thermoplasmatota archaeon]|nr:hypothetical protein [Candidatus Thermoplasmatota archaeon]